MYGNRGRGEPPRYPGARGPGYAQSTNETSHAEVKDDDDDA